MIVQKRPQSVVGYQNLKRYGRSKLGFHLVIEPVFSSDMISRQILTIFYVFYTISNQILAGSFSAHVLAFFLLLYNSIVSLLSNHNITFVTSA